MVLLIDRDWVLLIVNEQRVDGLRGWFLLAERRAVLESIECPLHQGSGVVLLRRHVFQLLLQLRFRGQHIPSEGDE